MPLRVITVKMHDELLQQIEAYAEFLGCSRSEAIRILLERALDQALEIAVRAEADAGLNKIVKIDDDSSYITIAREIVRKEDGERKRVRLVSTFRYKTITVRLV